MIRQKIVYTLKRYSMIIRKIYKIPCISFFARFFGCTKYLSIQRIEMLKHRDGRLNSEEEKWGK